MKTFLAQNQFLSAASLQPAAKAAASSSLSSLSEAAVTNSVSDAKAPPIPACASSGTEAAVRRAAASDEIHSLGVVVDRGTAQRLEIELRNAGYFSGPTASGAVWHGENGCSDPATPCDPTRPSQSLPALDVPPGPRLPADATVSAGLSDSQDVPAQMQESKARHSGLACDDKKPGDTTQESRPAHPATALSDEDLYWHLRFADDPFTRDLAEIPDPHAFFNKIIETDVWADDVPLFLKRFA